MLLYFSHILSVHCGEAKCLKKGGLCSRELVVVVTIIRQGRKNHTNGKWRCDFCSLLQPHEGQQVYCVFLCSFAFILKETHYFDWQKAAHDMFSWMYFPGWDSCSSSIIAVQNRTAADPTQKEETHHRNVCGESMWVKPSLFTCTSIAHRVLIISLHSSCIGVFSALILCFFSLFRFLPSFRCHFNYFFFCIMSWIWRVMCSWF